MDRIIKRRMTLITTTRLHLTLYNNEPNKPSLGPMSTCDPIFDPIYTKNKNKNKDNFLNLYFYLN